MPEPITAVWGVYNRARELVMLKPYDCTDNGWPEGYTVERLPIATPEMGAVVEKAIAFEKHVNDHGWSRGLGYDCTVTVSVPNAFHGHKALKDLLDAARAAGGAPHA